MCIFILTQEKNINRRGMLAGQRVRWCLLAKRRGAVTRVHKRATEDRTPGVKWAKGLWLK